MGAAGAVYTLFMFPMASVDVLGQQSDEHISMHMHGILVVLPTPPKKTPLGDPKDPPYDSLLAPSWPSSLHPPSNRTRYTSTPTS
jgi:hypothetical protein